MTYEPTVRAGGGRCVRAGLQTLGGVDGSRNGGDANHLDRLINIISPPLYNISNSMYYSIFVLCVPE